ncbi:hypothetical protein V6N11_030930 [Hibiscus sabdariffa]|uniref:Uncharacterized protein n=1 Tax=Hibiscus sabdariffa TaxID=183260 RepID=A0ABR2NRT1_9ROSI
MSAFRKAQAKGTRIGFLKWSAQSSERRSGRQVKAQKHTTKAQLKVQSKQSEKSRLYPYQVNLLTLKTGYRLKRWTNASSSLCKKRSKVGVHIRQDPRSEPSVKELIAILPVEYLLARRKEACKEGLSVTSLSSELAKLKPSRIVGLDQEGSVEPVFIHFLLSQREGCHFKISLFLYRMLSFFDTLIGPSSSIG